MEILLTPDQVSALNHFASVIVTDKGDRFYYFPYWHKASGNGTYERLRFDQLPEEVKDRLLKNQGIILPDDKPETAIDWLKKQKGYAMRTTYLYDLIYNDIVCAGLLTTSAFGDKVEIRPILSTQDIGNGAGCSVIKNFERN
jgi:hypothetical protein